MTVTYSVCVSGDGIDSFLGFEYCVVITLASRVFRILIPIITSSLRFLCSELGLRWPSCWAQLAQMLGYAYCGIAVTDSVRFCCGGIDSFLGFEYEVVITLASQVFEYFLRFFLRACVICAFLASLGSHGVTPPPFLPTLTVSSRAVPLLGF